MPTLASVPSSPEIQARLEAIIVYLKKVAGPDDELLHRLIRRQHEMAEMQAVPYARQANGRVSPENRK